MQMLAGTAKVEITCREEGAPCYTVSDKTKAHIPKELRDKRIVVHDPLFLKALVLDNGVHKLALIAMDTTAIGCRTISQNILGDSADDFMPRLRERLLAETGIPGDCVTVCASHTHPPGRLLCEDEEQLDQAVRAVKDALRNMAPVRVGTGSGHEARLTFNRTLKMKDGTDYTLRGCNPPPPDEEVEGMRPIDPEIGVLRIDRLDGTPLAVVYNFASHLLIGTPASDITADFPGITSGFLETSLSHDALAFFIQGAGGDVSEVAQLDRDHPRWGPQFGHMLAESVLTAYRSIVPSGADMAMASETVRLPLRTDIPETVAQLRRGQQALTASLRYTNLNFKTFLPLYLKYSLHPEFPLHCAYRYMQAEQSGNAGYEALARRNQTAIRKYLASLKAMEKMARNEENIATLLRHQEVIDQLGLPAVPAEIQGIRIGDCVFIAAPMEILVEIGLKVKQASPFKHTYIASLANGYLHYAPPASYYPRGGYEVTECLLAPEWEAIFEQTVQTIFSRLKAPA